MRGRGWLILIAVLIVVAVAIWGFSETAPPVATARAQRGEFVIDVKTEGEVQAVESRIVSRPRARWSRSQVVALAPEGSVVKEGDFLIQFDTSESDRRVEEKQNEHLNARAELESHRANSASRMAELRTALKTQEYSFEQAQLRFDQMEYEAETRRREQELELKKSELSLAEARDRIEAQKIIDEAERSKAELKVRQAELELEQAQKALDQQTINAPVDGLVVYKQMWRPDGFSKIKVGDTPWPGMELIELPDLSKMQIRTRVYEIDIQRIELGQEVIIEVDALAEQTFHGEITHIATLARRMGQSEVKVFDVDVLVEEEDSGLKPGMTASCRIITSRFEAVTSIPLEAVFEREGKTIVYLGGGHDQREVVLGERNSDHVVVEEGLAEGDEVCLRDPNVTLEALGGEDTGSGSAER